MRNITRSAAAVILVVSMALPAGAATRPSSRSSFYQSMKRFIILVLSRVSPPVGSPTAPPPEDPEITTTDMPVKTP